MVQLASPALSAVTDESMADSTPDEWLYYFAKSPNP
jgi:hypothetical protein